jgi:hypothetical protein
MGFPRCGQPQTPVQLSGVVHRLMHNTQFQWMPNHSHFVLRPNRDGEMSRFLRWVTATHTMRCHAHYHSSGEGHV